MLIFVLFIFLLNGIFCEELNISRLWPGRLNYYESSLSDTLKGILETNLRCLKTSQILPDGVTTLPLPSSSSYDLFITQINVSNSLIEEWKAMGRPTHMRSDPSQCNPQSIKQKSIFNQTGCQLKGYMHKDAPRCQKSYLKWICDSSQKSIHDKTTNNFVVPDANHLLASSFPPQPWLLIGRNALISMCGVISYRCGFAHSSASCFFQNSRGGACPISLINQVIDSHQLTSRLSLSLLILAHILSLSHIL